MMKKPLVLLLGILLIAAFLRFYLIGTVPPSPDWDEAALGYNAYSIMHTGRDEYGKFLPIIMRSFDDYKPALYSYLTMPFIATLGLNLVAVRLPSAIFGILTVAAVYFIVKELFSISKDEKTKKKNIPLALLTAFLLAISPWHIQFSRIAFESNVGLALNVFGLLFFLKGLKKPWLLSLSTLSFAAALYVYQSEKVFTPLFALLIVAIFWKEIIDLPKKYLIAAVVIGVFAAFPLLFVTLTDKQALARARGVSVFSDSTQLLEQSATRLAVSQQNHDYLGLLFNNRRIVFAKQIFANYLSHYDLNWLFIHGDIARHHAPNMGLLYIIEFPFLFIGMYQLLFGKWSKKIKLLFAGWFLLAPIPASVTSGVPHAVRTLNFLPTFQLFIALGLLTFISFLSSIKILGITSKNFTLLGVGIVAFLYVINGAYYLDQYFVQQNITYSEEWQYGYQQAVQVVKQNENKYSKIIVSNQPYLDQSYMFFLFYLQYSPLQYQQETKDSSGGFRETHVFGKYEFRPINWSQENHSENTLYIGSPEDFPPGVATIDTIKFLNGKDAIKIVKGS